MNISTTNFTYHDNKFITEISDIQKGQQSIFHQLYPDACDEGIVLVSEKTGNESTWYVDSTEYTKDEDHELVCYHLLPTEKTIRKFPKLTSTSMVIFND